MARPKGSGGGTKVNKSAAIRDMIEQNPRAKSKEIVRLLAEKGLKVQPTLVYYIRSREKHLKRRGKHQRAVSTGSPLQLLIKVKALSKEAGGMRNLKQLVDILAE
jgi:hypothetical protein